MQLRLICTSSRAREPPWTVSPCGALHSMVGARGLHPSETGGDDSRPARGVAGRCGRMLETPTCVTYLLSATAAIALMASGAAAHDNHPVTLIEGLGDHYHAIATAQKDAQSYFNQGLILTFAFNHAEAIRAYGRAAELDPASPMPLWGIAYALGPNYNLPAGPDELKQAHETVQKALKLAEKAPARERAYVEALAARYSSDPNADLCEAGAGFLGAHEGAERSLSRRSRCGDALCREHDEPQSLEPVDQGWQALGQDDGDRRGAGARAEARSQPSRRQPSLHPCGRSLAASGMGAWRRPSGWRPSRRPPGTWSTCRRTSTCWSATTRRRPMPT